MELNFILVPAASLLRLFRGKKVICAISDQPNILQKRHLFAQLAILLCLSIGRIFFNATAEARNIKISFLPLPVWDLPTSKKKNYATYHLKSRACELKGSTMSLTYVWHIL
ncbi:hypothetical protein ACSS6W_008026 [Trichoderma asperelloides]